MGLITNRGRNPKCPYLAPEWDAVRERHGYSHERVLARFLRRTIAARRMGIGKAGKYLGQFFFDSGIGNPYASSHAHKFMVRATLQSQSKKRAARRQP